MKISLKNRFIVPIITAMLAYTSAFSQASMVPNDTMTITDTDLPHFCGSSAEYITQANLFSLGKPVLPQYIFIYHDPCLIEATDPTAIRFNMNGTGRFKVYFEDLYSNTNDGFDDPILGTDRINTLLATLDYVENTIDIQLNSSTDFIEIYVERSIATFNQATTADTYLAFAGPYFLPNTFGIIPGFFDGELHDHVISGNDPEVCRYDGHVCVNFDDFFSTQANAFFPINYWNDFNNTNATCSFDLFTVLLHEITHAMGWFSAVEENTTTFVAQCENNNNSFSGYDFNFLYYGTPTNPGGFVKVVDNSLPAIDPQMASFTNPLRSNMIWLNNLAPPTNQPIYAGVVDPNYNFIPGSFMSHLNANTLSFTGMSQVSPGYQPNYVMGPVVGRAQRKREWTIPELRALLTLGYNLNPNFANAATLNPFDPLDLNGPIVTANTPAYRTNSATPMLSYNTPFNFMELMQADQTMTNANVPNQAPTSFWTTTVAGLANVFDNESNLLRIMPNTLFGIRGVSDGGNQAGANNHNCVVETPNGDGFTYTPIPGFHGRAQFGFYLWDGHERGALRIVTIDVAPTSNYAVTPGNQLIVYPDLEDGTEIRQRALNPNFENAQIDDWQYESIFAGQNFSGGHNYNFLTNWWNLAGGDVVENSWYACFMGTIPQHGDYGSPTSDWNSQNFGSFFYPTPVVTPGSNQRYHHFQGGINYSTLINQVQDCNVYHFECDLNFEHTNFTVGQTFQFQLQFVDNPFPGLHTALFYTAPVQVTITTVAPDSWQHVTFDFQYCGNPTFYMNLLVQGIVAPTIVVTGTGNTNGPGNGGPPLPNTFTPAFYGPGDCPFIDNIALSQVSPTPPPVTLTVNANPATVCYGTASNLTVSSAPYLPCNATYSWSPATTALNQSNTSVTTGPVTSTTTYTATISYACTQTSSGTVTVTPSALPTITPAGPYCSNDNIGHQLVGSPTTPSSFWTGTGVTNSGVFTPSTAGAGTFVITYNYVPFAGCTTSVTTNIVVTQNFAITFGTNGPFCVTQGAQPLFAQPSGGNWSGIGVTANQFNPSISGTGTFTLTYTVTIGACTNSATTTVVVTPAPIVTITPVGPLCQYDAAQNLTVSQGTGTFSGTGVVGSQFNPTISGVGSFLVTFNGTVGNCTVTATMTIVVLPGSMPNNWPKFISGATSRSTINGVITDGFGNIYITGHFSSNNSNFPTYGVIPATGQIDLFVAKYNEQCGSVWIRTISTTSAIVDGKDITLDANGDVYVTGFVQGTNVNFGSSFFLTSPTGNSEAFLLKLDKNNGTTIFAKQSTSPVTGSPSNSIGKAVIYSAANNAIYVEGEFKNTIKFGTLPNVASVGGNDVFVARYSTTGTEAWSTNIGSAYATEGDLAGSLGTDASGNLYVGTSVSGAVVFPVSLANVSGSYNVFISKYNSGNTYIGGVTTGGATTADDIFMNDMVVDNTGRCYFTGAFTGTVTLNVSLTAVTKAIYTAWATSTLSFASTWSIKSADAAGPDDSGNSIALNGSNLFVTGTTNPATGSFPGFTPTTVPGAVNSKEIFTYKISTAGVPSFLEYTTSTPYANNKGLCIAVNNANASIFSGGSLGIGTSSGTSVSFVIASFTPSTAENGIIARSNQSGSFFRTGNPETQENNLLDEIEIDSLTSVSLFPNPNSGSFTLFFNEGIPENCKIQISDIAGRQLLSNQYQLEYNSLYSAQIAFNEVPNGLYFVEIVSEKKPVVLKVMINK